MNNIRIAKRKDLESIVSIYNQAIKAGFETADTIELNIDEKFEWFTNHNPDSYPLFVYEDNGKIIAWMSISPYRPGRKALRFTIEISYYVHQNFKRKGIGTELIKHAIAEGKKLKYKTIIAIVLDKNKASICLLQKFNFKKWAQLPDIADFDGIECGHVYYGLRIT